MLVKKKEKIQENSHLSSHLPACFDSRLCYSRSASALKIAEKWHGVNVESLFWERSGELQA